MSSAGQQGHADEPGRDRWQTVAILAIGYTAAAASAYVLPIIAGSFAEALQFRIEDIGYVLSVELVAIMIGAFAVFPRIPQHRLRPAIGVSLAVLIIANLLSAETGSASQFIVLRGLAGLVEGIVQAGVLAIGARLVRPESAFTAVFTLLTLVLAAIFMGTPQMVARWGYGSAIHVLGALALVALMLVPALDQRPAARAEAVRPPARPGTTMVILAAWFGFIAGQYALFVYAEQIAHDIGVDFATIGLIFALASLVTIPAPWVAGWSIRRFGLAAPIAAATLISAGSILGFPFASGATSFGIAFLVFNCAVFYAFPLFSTLGARVDETGGVSALLPAAQAFAMVLGPVIASASLGFTHSYLLLAMISAAVSLIALLAVLPAGSSDRQQQAQSVEPISGGTAATPQADAA